MGVAGYRYRLKEEGGVYGPWTDVDDVLTFQFTGLEPDTTYVAQIQAYCDTGGLSNHSSEYTFRTATACGILDGGASDSSLTDIIDGGGSDANFDDTIDFNCGN